MACKFLDIEHMFDTLRYMIEHVYVESMFAEQTFLVKDLPIKGDSSHLGKGCHTRWTGWTL